MTIYYGCENNEQTVYDWDFEEFKSKLKDALKDIKYNYALVDISACISYGAIIVTYKGEVPERMKNHKNRWEFKDDTLIRLSTGYQG